MHVLVDTRQLVGVAAIPIADEVEHHLRRVVRLADGALVSVSDGEGRWLMCMVRHQSGGLLLEPTGAPAADVAARGVRLATAIPKGDRIDWLIQKATELGVAEVTLLHTERSVVRWTPDRAEKQVARLRRISDEALRQSRRVWRMTIIGPFDAAAVLPAAVLAEPGGRGLSAADELVAIGPEGGWTDTELSLASARVDLGEAILRTETAAIAGAVLAAAARR